MCTVSVIPWEGGLRLVINRDELRTRPPGLRPRLIDLDRGIKAAWPTDAHAGGTWVGAGNHGLVLALLNGNPRPYPSLPPSETLTSRGLVIPALIRCRSAEEAIVSVGAMDLERFAPFRLVAVDGSVLAEAVWDRAGVRTVSRPLGAACFVSSGLGDDRVRLRLDLFEAIVVRRGATTEAQDEFHLHRWPDRPEISVIMSRADARTVSVTRVEMSASRATRKIHTDDAGTVSVSLDPDRADARIVTAGMRNGRVPC